MSSLTDERTESNVATPPRRTEDATQRAAELLELVFGAQSEPWSFRLWDGTVVHCGSRPADALVHFKSREVFRRLFTGLDLVAFGEAYIEGELDFDGDIFDVMERASSLKFEGLPWATKLKVWALARKL